MQNLGPAFTLTIEGLNELKISVDLVPCILLDGSQWPGEGFEPNPYTSPSVSRLFLSKIIIYCHILGLLYSSEES